MTVELAEIHVEDIKSGYILHHPEHGPLVVRLDAVSWYSEAIDPEVADGPDKVDLSVIGHEFPYGGWITFDFGATVEVEA